MEFEESE